MRRMTTPTSVMLIRVEGTVARESHVRDRERIVKGVVGGASRGNGLGSQRHRRERIPISRAPPRLTSGQEGICRCRTWAGLPLRRLPLWFHGVRVIERRGEWVHQRDPINILRIPYYLGMQRSTRTRGEGIIRTGVRVRNVVLGKRGRGGLPRRRLNLEPNGGNTRWRGNAPRHLQRYWPLVSVVKGRREVT